jgi:hypothetical protein
MAFEHDGKRVYFNADSPDFCFVKHIDSEYNDAECSETKREVWKYIPGNREITRTVHTKYAADIYRRLRLPAFGKATKMPPSATTSYGDEVFMEWNPMVFFTSDGKLHKILQKYKTEYETNNDYVREKIILDSNCTKYSPWYWTNNTEYEYMAYIEKNCKTVLDPPIRFRNIERQPDCEVQQTTTHRLSTRTDAPPPSANPPARTGGFFSINKIKQKVDGTTAPRERVQDEVAFRLMNFYSLVGVKPDDIKNFMCHYGADPNMYMRIVIPRDKETGENRNRAFVNFRSQEELDTVYNILANQQLIFEDSVVDIQRFED